MISPEERRDRDGTDCTALTTSVRVYRPQELRHNRAARIIGDPIDNDLQERWAQTQSLNGLLEDGVCSNPGAG